MAIRNFFLSATIDGRQTRVTGGPASKTGGMEIKVYMRNEGEITIPLEIECYADEEGKLRMYLDIKDHDRVIIDTER